MKLMTNRVTEYANCDNFLISQKRRAGLLQHIKLSLSRVEKNKYLRKGRYSIYRLFSLFVFVLLFVQPSYGNETDSAHNFNLLTLHYSLSPFQQIPSTYLRAMSSYCLNIQFVLCYIYVDVVVVERVSIFQDYSIIAQLHSFMLISYHFFCFLFKYKLFFVHS